MHQQEISMNSGTETDLSEINQTEARCNEEKPQETPPKNLFQENQNCDEVTVERKDKKKVTTIPDEGLTKEEEHNAINRIIKEYKKSSKSLSYICSGSVKVKLNIYCDFCRNFYHSSRAHPTCSFASTFPANLYINQSCIENNYKSFHCYTSFHLSAELYNYIEDVDCISNLFHNWNKFPDNLEKDCKNVSIPMEHHCGSPSQHVFLPVHSKPGIRNSYNNCYLSVVIQSIMGTELYKFFPSELEAPTNIIRALWRCRNMLCCGENRRVINLKDDFMIFSREVMHGNLNDKMQHYAFEFYENLIDNLSTQCLTVDKNFKAIFMTFVKCFDCGRITGDPIKREKSIILSIPQLKKPVTLESLIYSKFFCNINNRTKIVKCDCDSGSFIQESSTFLQPPRVLVIYTSRNIDGRKYCDTAVEIPASLYFDHLVARKHPSSTYSLVSEIYRYGNVVEQGHFNCALFSNNSVVRSLMMQ